MRKNLPFKLTIFFVCLMIILIGCIRDPQEKPLEPETSSMFEKGEVHKVKVLKDTVYIRNGNSVNFPVVTTVKKDIKLDVTGQVGKWYIVVMDDGKVGAVSPDEVKPIVDEPDLSGKSKTIKDLTPNEKEMLRLLNAERTKKGLPPLKVDLELAEVARFKSQDMIDNNYFSHYSPTYGSPFQMMKSFGVKYIYAGENLAGDSSVKDAHEALMNSEGHKNNILNKNFTHVGIGVKEGSGYGKIFAQMFVGR